MLHIGPVPSFVGMAQSGANPAEAARTVQSFLGELQGWADALGPDRWVATTAMVIDDPAIANLVAWQISDTRLMQVNDARDTMIRILGQTTGITFVDAAQRSMFPEIPDSVGNLIKQTKNLLAFWQTHQVKEGFPWMALLGVTAVAGTVIGTAWWSSKYWHPYLRQFKVARCARKCKGRKRVKFRSCQSRCMKGLRLSV